MLEFRGRHSGNALENTRKILRIVEGKHVGDLRKIQAVFSDELLGALDFKRSAIGGDGASRLLVKKLAKIAFAIAHVRADRCDLKLALNVFLKVLLNGCDQMVLHTLLARKDLQLVDVVDLADQKDQQLLKVGLDELLAAENGILFFDQPLESRLILRDGKRGLRLFDDARNEGAKLLIELGVIFFEKGHGG